MLKAELIGNLGADAEVKSADGTKFITFRVADTYKYTDQNGKEVSQTSWVDCTINNADAKIFPYLKSGVKVFVRGNARTRVYSSKKDRCMKAGLTIAVAEIELCGGSSDVVPRQIINPDTMEMVEVRKFYWIDKARVGMKKTDSVDYIDKSGQLYKMDYRGFVTPAVDEQPAEQQAEEQAANTNENNAQDEQKTKG